MLGYPYSYLEDSLKESSNTKITDDKKFLSFFLTPLNNSESESLDLLAMSTLPVILDNSSLPLGDEFCYRFCDEIAKICVNIKPNNETGTIVFDFDNFTRFVENSDLIITNVAAEFKISKNAALEQAKLFFDNKNVLVQATGVQGLFYKTGSMIQSGGSALLVTHTLGLAKLAGATGLHILQAQPALAIAIPTTGALFFLSCGLVVGDNLVGRTLTSAGNILLLPMKGFELVWNSYMNPPIQKTFGIPVILNMTSTTRMGPGYSIDDLKRIYRIVGPSLKERIIKFFKNL